MEPKTSVYADDNDVDLSVGIGTSVVTGALGFEVFAEHVSTAVESVKDGVKDIHFPVKLLDIKFNARNLVSVATLAGRTRK